MGFTSQDDLLTQISAGKYKRVEFAKTTAPVHTAAGWHLLSSLAGYPPATTFPAGTDLMFKSCCETIGDGTTLFAPQIGGLVTSPATKHLLSIGALITAAAGSPWQAKLVDLQGYYLISGANVTDAGTTRTMINTDAVIFDNSGGHLRATYTNDWSSLTRVMFTTAGALPTGLAVLTDYWLVRQSSTTAKISTSLANAIAGTYISYTDAGTPVNTLNIQMPRYDKGVGCQAFFVSKTQPTAGGPQLSASSYTNPAGTAARSFAGTPVMGATAGAYATRVIHSGTGAGMFGAFLPLAGGDTGIASLESFVFNNGTAYTGSGVLAFCIVKTIADICLPATGLWCERDLVNQLPSLPEIKNGACLQWMLYGTGATTTGSPFQATMELAWGG